MKMVKGEEASVFEVIVGVELVSDFAVVIGAEAGLGVCDFSF